PAADQPRTGLGELRPSLWSACGRRQRCRRTRQLVDAHRLQLTFGSIHVDNEGQGLVIAVIPRPVQAALLRLCKRPGDRCARARILNRQLSLAAIRFGDGYRLQTSAGGYGWSSPPDQRLSGG